MTNEEIVVEIDKAAKLLRKYLAPDAFKGSPMPYGLAEELRGIMVSAAERLEKVVVALKV